jgi:hypothetical protein
MNIKALLSIMVLAALTACGDCEPETVIGTGDIATAPVVMPEPTPEPAPTPSPAPITVCPESGCAPSPTPLPVRPIVTTPSPEPICVRDTSIALVLVDGVLTDNCGNKYGQTV